MLSICRGHQAPGERNGKGTAVLICVSLKDGCLQGQHGAPPFFSPPWIWKPGAGCGSSDSPCQESCLVFLPLQLFSAKLQEQNITRWLENVSEAAAQGTPDLALKLPC